MKRFYYDLHIHTALSPCADDDMTPNNIVNMAKLSGLDVIAVTDHNSAQNVKAVMAAAKKLGGPLVLAGMELTTAEDIHAILIFPSAEAAIECEKEARAGQLRIKNKKEIFGNQLIVNEFDDTVGEDEYLLIPACAVPIDELPAFAAKFGAAAFPAHIDKPSNGIIAVLGAFTPDMGFVTAEITANCGEKLTEQLKEQNITVIHSSDAHFLGAISERSENNFLELNALTPRSVIEYLNRGQQNG